MANNFNFGGSNNTYNIIVVDNSRQLHQSEDVQVQQQPLKPEHKKDRLPWWKLLWEIFKAYFPTLPAIIDFFRAHPP